MLTSIPYISTKKQTAVTLGNFDIFEDETILINRLYYAVPDFKDGQFSCSFFYEEKTFRKELNGDLTLVRSEYGTDDPPKPELPSSE